MKILFVQLIHVLSLAFTLFFCAMAPFHTALADDKASADIQTTPSLYLISPGDVLAINVWNEATLTLPQVLVRPDGYISMPLLGDVKASGLSVPALQSQLKKQLIAFLRDEPILTLSVLQLNGNSVYILGKVNRPGAFVMPGQLDVTQALALAGGLAAFADEDDIVVLRRNPQGEQKVLRFRYDQVKSGKQLSSNHLLQSGDVILVP
jgi:polysaccharide biosynthesis/export protein